MKQGGEKAANAVQLKTQYSYTGTVHRLPIQLGWEELKALSYLFTVGYTVQTIKLHLYK